MGQDTPRGYPRLLEVERSEGRDDAYVATIEWGPESGGHPYEFLKRGGLVPTITTPGDLFRAAGVGDLFVRDVRQAVVALDRCGENRTKSPLPSGAVPDALTLQDAFLVAYDLVQDMETEHELVLVQSVEFDSAWAFVYQTRAAALGDWHMALGGNAPIFVPRDGSPPWTGVATKRLEDQI